MDDKLMTRLDEITDQLIQIPEYKELGQKAGKLALFLDSIIPQDCKDYIQEYEDIITTMAAIEEEFLYKQAFNDGRNSQ